MPITRQNVDFQDVSNAVLRDAVKAYPECRVELWVSGNLPRDFDNARLQQAVTNLLTDTVRYRAKNQLVIPLANGETETIVVQVKIGDR